MPGFYMLSLLSGFFEIAPFVIALHGKGVMAALTVALCYQLGNLAPCPLRLSLAMTRAAALCGAAFLAVYALTGLFPLLCIAVALLSIALQSARSSEKSAMSKPLKRLLRVAGFGLGLFGMPLALLISGAAAVVLVWMGKSNNLGSAVFVPRLNAMNAVMVLHQVHYFSYCYAAIALAAVYAGTGAALGLFLAGWVVYITAARLYRRYQLQQAFFFGHSLLVLLLLGMYFVPSLPLKAALWVLTGLGGTTEFCIARLSRERGGTGDGGIFAENTGHVLGVALCMAAYALTQELFAVLFVSAAAAGGAIVLMAVVVLLGRRHFQCV